MCGCFHACLDVAQFDNANCLDACLLWYLAAWINEYMITSLFLLALLLALIWLTAPMLLALILGCCDTWLIHCFFDAHFNAWIINCFVALMLASMLASILLLVILLASMLPASTMLPTWMIAAWILACLDAWWSLWCYCPIGTTCIDDACHVNNSHAQICFDNWPLGYLLVWSIWFFLWLLVACSNASCFDDWYLVASIFGPLLLMLPLPLGFDHAFHSWSFFLHLWGSPIF